VTYTNFGYGEMVDQGLSEIKLITSFLHAHSLLKRMETSKIQFDETVVPINDCMNCGAGHHGMHDGHSMTMKRSGDIHDGMMMDPAFKILDEPVTLKAGEGFKTTCVYQRPSAMGSDHSMGTANVVGGFKSDEEMCLSFFYYACSQPIPNPGSFLLYSDICGYV
jgi:hypothetical protein